MLSCIVAAELLQYCVSKSASANLLVELLCYSTYLCLELHKSYISTIFLPRADYWQQFCVCVCVCVFGCIYCTTVNKIALHSACVWAVWTNIYIIWFVIFSSVSDTSVLLPRLLYSVYYVSTLKHRWYISHYKVGSSVDTLIVWQTGRLFFCWVEYDVYIMLTCSKCSADINNENFDMVWLSLPLLV